MPTTDRPNIVHIITDQHSADAFSCEGNPYVQTPNFDRLAAQSTRFARAYSNHPLCVPARASMLTGLTSHCTELEDADGEYRPWTDAELREKSIGWTLKRAGYDVPYAGKWHVVNLAKPPDHGFEWILPEPHGYYCGKGEIINTACRSFFQREREEGKPFFLTTSYIQPHGICMWGILTQKGDWRPNASLPWPDGEDPWDENHTGDGYPFPVPPTDQPLAEFIEEQCPPLPENFAIPEREPEILQKQFRRPEIGFGTISENGNRTQGLTENQLWRLYRWTYFRLVEQADRQVGELLDMLDEFGLSDNTVVVFTSDHGEANGHHQLKRKNYLYEESARVPLFIRYPGVLPAGAVDKRLVDNCMDLLPTVCDYAGIETPDHCQGQSLRALIEKTTDGRDALVIESRYGRAVVTDQYKYCLYEQSDSNPEQLFDLAADPLEMQNLIDAPNHAAALEDCRAKLQQWNQRHGNPPLPRH